MDANREGHIEFHDWEVLQNSEDGTPVVDFVGIESHFNGAIRSDYFSIDGQTRYVKTDADGDAEGDRGSVESDNPGWIDPSPSFERNTPISTEFWSDSSTDPSEDRKLPNFDATNELCPVEMETEHSKFTELDESRKKSEIEEIWDKTSEKCFLDEITDGNKIEKTPEFSNTSELDGHGGFNSGKLRGEEEEEYSTVAAVERKSDGEGEKRRIVWWKVPFELIKYCVVRVSPVWSLSVAAAFVGFIILGRRLYKMKQKNQSLKLKVALDEKKASQFADRAARLNEAFSIVRRVPLIRPSLPASGVTPWPVMSMR